jgi:hypothetical protein
MKHTASATKSSSARGTLTRPRKATATDRQFAVCVDNNGYEASLERNKIYVVLSDKDAESGTDIRASTKAARITCSQPTVSSPSRFPQRSRRRF